MSLVVHRTVGSKSVSRNEKACAIDPSGILTRLFVAALVAGGPSASAQFGFGDDAAWFGCRPSSPQRKTAVKPGCSSRPPWSRLAHLFDHPEGQGADSTQIGLDKSSKIRGPGRFSGPPSPQVKVEAVFGNINVGVASRDGRLARASSVAAGEDLSSSQSAARLPAGLLRELMLAAGEFRFTARRAGRRCCR